jgi:hypothetical protein
MPIARRGPFRVSSLSMNAIKLPTVLTGRGVLVRALARALGGDVAAEEWLRFALEDAGMDVVPEGRDAFEAFVREEILPRLMPDVRLDALHDLVRRTIGEEGSLHPPPLKPHGAAPGIQVRLPTQRPRVVLVEEDSFRRISFSRELVRGGFDVEVVARAEEVPALDAFHALVLSLDPSGEKLARTLAEKRTRAGIVAWDQPEHRDAHRRMIDLWPTDRFALVARDAPPAMLAARIRMVLA